MELNEYQRNASQTALYPYIIVQIRDNKFPTQLEWVYPLIGLSGEVGELSNKLKKIIRGDEVEMQKVNAEVLSELGDILWYISELARRFGFSLDFVAEQNLNKLALRKEKGTIRGSDRKDE